MPPDDTKKRKACQTCTHSKAKCSPFEDRTDLCYRCQRLGKKCVFEETIRKRGPKTRSRVKQLEQRVDTLINLLAANGQNVSIGQAQSLSHLPTVATEGASPQTTFNAPEATPQSAPYITPVETPDFRPVDEELFKPYDPIEADVLSQNSASKLLKEFGESFIQSFPFVVIPTTTDAMTLRNDFPFLFHSIMTVTTYRTPATQRALSEELKEQIATRILRHSHKSLEILQGLLIYGAWYHFFYNPTNQQMATIIQLCVAMVQDLGLSRSRKEKTQKMPFSEKQFGMKWSSEGLFAERRAFLGTYYLAVAFAQAWRKRSTMRHTRYMTQCCALLAERKEYSSDELITPLIELSELTCRINDYFSYDDMENAEVTGDMILSFTTLSFRSDLDRIRNSVSASAKENKNLYLGMCLVEIWVYECALHGTFWTPPSLSETSAISISRTVALYHCLRAMNAYLTGLLAIPQDSLHHLAFPSWTGWFYAIIVACKLVFLEDNERHSQTDLDPVHREVSKLECDKFGNPPPYEPYTLPIGFNTTSLWDPVTVAREAEVQSLFDKFIKKMEFTIPADPNALQCRNPVFDPLFSMICLQRSLLHGFTKKMKEHVLNATGPQESAGPSIPCSRDNVAEATQAPDFPHYDSQPQMTAQTQQIVEHIRLNPIPLSNTFHFSSLNFDSIASPNSLPAPDLSQHELLWDTVMDDFTFPI
ncbi:hypothetical protein K458DRAFT_390404 [Lentithecium fluviatile CBS 122367]|uniref:Zn(2)-C6 fungal-type domain-containing protein n=1 Tax=Lentithecium fluviatile CBS 122367 TaxID=1168545 RepID=A0A6G1IXZ5_9PLEO|nr:hypothetical protein K458DRAFT_390404 [Lentithecium fluviatile CBS 122367]